MATDLIGLRLKALREEKKLSQDEVARLFGFKDRQTVSAIETGERKVSAEELLIAVREFGKPLDYFTDPFRLVGEGNFNWRQSNVPQATLGAYERITGQVIAAFRALGADLGQKAPLFRRALRMTRHSRFEEAAEAGERFAAECGLGEVPSRRLRQVMEDDLGILVLMVDPNHDGVSGAACRLPELDVVLINRNEVAGRRHFDLAHELFHILTWEAMPPEHVEDASEISANRVEQLANSFASAMLMPARIVDDMGDWKALKREALVAPINSAADELEVTATALLWRLVSIGRLTRAEARAVPAAALRHNGRAVRPKETAPPLFSKPFIEIVARAIAEGRVSTRKIAGLLNVAVDDLGALFAAYGIAEPYEL